MTVTICQRDGCDKQLPPSKARPRKWCSDRCRKLARAPGCVDCGRLVNTDGRVTNPNERCVACAGARTARLHGQWIVESFNDWIDQFGVPPTATDWNPMHARATGQMWRVERLQATGRTWPSVTSVQRHYGSWQEFIRQQGWEPFGPGQYGRDGEDHSLDVEVARLYREGLSIYQIAKRFDATSGSIRCRLERAGEPRRSRVEAQRLRWQRERSLA
jgi:hypothetical protein